MDRERDRRGQTGEPAAAEPITTWISAARAGDSEAEDRLYRAVYAELRRIARAQRARLVPGDTWSTTVLVSELYLRLEGAASLSIADRRHFFALAARIMRQILIDGARRSAALRRGGNFYLDPIEDEGALPAPDRAEELLALDEALDLLAARDRALADLVELHFFAGLSLAEIASSSEKSERTLRRDWRRARAFLHDRLRGEPEVGR